MAGVDYESVLCVKPQVHVFRIPPRSSNRGYRAADWKLDQPDWSGRLRLVAKGRELAIKLEDKNSGDLFAKCPIETYPGIAVESVTDSSRYFVLRIMDDNGRSAFIGIGFEDRGDSFDLNVALQDHFKHLKQEKDAEKAVEDLQKGPKLDLGFKEGQTIRINISTKKNSSGDEGTPKKERPKGAGGGGGLGLLPPPPGGVKLPPPGGASSGASGAGAFALAGGAPKSDSPSTFSPFSEPGAVSNSTIPATTQQTSNTSSSGGSNVDMLLDLDFGGGGGAGSIPSQGQVQGQSVNVAAQSKSPASDFGTNFDLLSSSSGGAGSNVAPAGGPSDPWGEFTSASSSNNSEDANWVQF